MHKNHFLIHWLKWKKGEKKMALVNFIELMA